MTRRHLRGRGVVLRVVNHPPLIRQLQREGLRNRVFVEVGHALSRDGRLKVRAPHLGESNLGTPSIRAQGERFELLIVRAVDHGDLVVRVRLQVFDLLLEDLAGIASGEHRGIQRAEGLDLGLVCATYDCLERVAEQGRHDRRFIDDGRRRPLVDGCRRWRLYLLRRIITNRCRSRLGALR
jgi:hypothetical protein